MAPAAEGKALRSLQRKAKKLAKESGTSEADQLAELLAQAGLEEQAEEVQNAAEESTSAAKKDENGNDDSEKDARTVSAVLTSHPLSRDVHIEQFTLLFHGHELLMDAKLELNHGRCVMLSYIVNGVNAVAASQTLRGARVETCMSIFDA
jgi:hypothetical protein